MLRFAAISSVIIGVALSACGDSAPSQKPQGGDAPVQQQGSAAPSSQSAPQPEQAPATASTLDLSYSEDSVDVRDLSEEELSRHQVDEWFEAQQDEEKKLSVKPKVRLKEDATLDQTMGNYRDSLDGAEMGIEYKTP